MSTKQANVIRAVLIAGIWATSSFLIINLVATRNEFRPDFTTQQVKEALTLDYGRAEAQAKIDAFVAAYPESTWTDQAAEAVKDARLRMHIADGYADNKRDYLFMTVLQSRAEARDEYASIDMSNAERLMVCEQQTAINRYAGGVTIGLKYVARPGAPAEAVQKWCPNTRPDAK